MEKLLSDPKVLAIILWSIPWKGWSLWRASKNNQKEWFVALLIINTAAILEIIYLLFFQKKNRLWDKILKRLNG